MNSEEISLWLDRRWLEALDRQFPDGGLQKKLEDYVEVLTCQLPREVQERIRGEIQAEDRLAQEQHEASRRFAVFHVTQDGESGYFLSEGRMEFLHAAYKLRLHLKGGGQRFADSILNRRAISEEQFDQYVSERMENTGRVTGAFDIDLDKGEFTALHIMDGWKTFRVKDITTAAYHAMRKGHLPKEKRLEIFLDRLQGRELTANSPKPIEVQGARRLRSEDITFGESIEEMDGVLNFYLDCRFPVDQVFGTHVETDANDNYLNVYANYDMATGEVRDELEITLCRGDGADVQMVYKLDIDERSALLEKMRDYCQEQTGQSLEEFAASFRMDDPAESQTIASPGQVPENGMRVRDVLQMDTPYDIFLTCGPEHGHIPLDVLNKLTESGRETYAPLLDAVVTNIRSVGTEDLTDVFCPDMGLELTLSGITPEELNQFYEDYESHQWAEDHMTMFM